MSVSQQGPNPPIPEPFWLRGWRTLWRWRPACYECGMQHRPHRFRDRAAWGRHFIAHHVDGVRNAHTADETPNADRNTVDEYVLVGWVNQTWQFIAMWNVRETFPDTDTWQPVFTRRPVS